LRHGIVATSGCNHQSAALLRFGLRFNNDGETQGRQAE
jgi:hypothetical protein